jgi:diguanylate cyclase (GGDEF)-like protein
MTIPRGNGHAMFGMERRFPRPVLLVIVYGIFLVIVGATAMTQTIMVSAQFSTSTINNVIGSDTALVRLFVAGALSPEDVGPTGPDAERLAALEERLRTLLAPGKIVHVEVRLPDGTVIASDRPEARGIVAPTTTDFATALQGRTATAGIDLSAESEAMGPALMPTSVLREYFPLVTDGGVMGVVAVWRDAEPILTQLDEMRRNVVLLTLSAGLIASAVLFFVFRSAQKRISRQTRALIDASRLDVLTGRLNHGALVDAVAEAVEHGRAEGSAFSLALVDVDNFRRLNEMYGHGAGDDALMTVLKGLVNEAPGTALVGRYGPDELMLLIPGAEVSDLRVVVERLRAGLADRSLQYESSEQLPLTISAGICTFPDHADSVTELLTVAANCLHEAKASGGDAVRDANAIEVAPAEARTFDVFQGLILAVDTKDRYTKRHSEDVARYGTFLAEQMGLDPELIATIRVAGLLHDVGKIGIPDQILRKPGPLTPDEYAVVKQHVALGDLIVRDLPDVALIRAGVRHHHERWDGKGYLDGLAGAEIPLVARILAVGDAFSAMTTTRPYRKAMDVREALTRLEDASDSQLDANLVEIFIRAIETAPDAPLPGGDVQPLRLWTPYRHVA